MQAGILTIGKGVLAAALLYALSYMLGDLTARREGRAASATEKLVNGFVWLLAIFGAAAFPFYILRYRVAFTPLVWIFSLLLAALAVLWVCLRRRSRSLRPRRKRDLSFLQDIWFWICLLLVAEHMFTVLRGYEQCSDDQLYISISNIAYEQDRISCALSAWGGYGPVVGTSNPFSAWELFVAWLARLLTLRPVFIYRSFLPLVTMPLCYLSAYGVGQRLFGEGRKARMFVALYGVIFLFSRGVETASHGTALFWMGKAVFYYLLLPRLLSLCLDIVEERDGRGTWWNAAAALLAGAALTTIGQYSGVIYIFALGLPYLLSLAVHYRQRRQRLWKCVRNVLLCALPVLVILFYTFFSQYEVLVVRANEVTPGESVAAERAGEPETAGLLDGQSEETTAPGSALASETEPELTAEERVEAPGALGTWLTALKYRRCSDGVFFWLGLVSMLGLAVFPRVKGARAIGWGGVALLCTFLNPPLADLVGKYVTTRYVYWRLWHLLTLDMTTAAAAVAALSALSARLCPAPPETETEGLPAAVPPVDEEDELARLERELAESGGQKMSGETLASLLCAACMAAVVALSLLCGPGYRYQGLSTVDNLEHALPACDDVISYITEKEGGDEYSLFADRIEFRSMPRQYSSLTQVYIGRWGDFSRWTIGDTSSTFRDLERLVFGAGSLGGAARELLTVLGTDYVLSETPLETAGSDYVPEREFEYDYIHLWLYARVE